MLQDFCFAEGLITLVEVLVKLVKLSECLFFICKIEIISHRVCAKNSLECKGSI